jgi:hypothetical protein
VYDATVYGCKVTSTNGTSCETTTRLIIKENIDNEKKLNAKFLKKPVSSVVLEKTVVSFCARISPPECETVWHVCGKRISDNSKGFLVSTIYALN